MKRTKFAVLLCLAIGTPAAAPQSASQNGSITGWVKDYKNRPVAGATVSAPVPLVSGSDAYSPTTADAQGYFKLAHVRPGRHLIIASKDSAGFGDPRWWVMSIGAPPPLEVNILPGEALGPITIHVGTPHGRILCRIISADTGAPVQAEYELTIPSIPDASLSSATFPDGFINSPVPAVPVNLAIKDQAGGIYQPVLIENILVLPKKVKKMKIKLKLKNYDPPPQPWINQ